jgi:hypothetical protein
MVMSSNIHCVAFQFVSPGWPVCMIPLEYMTYLAPSLAICVKGYRYGAKVRKMQESLSSSICVRGNTALEVHIYIALVKL